MHLECQMTLLGVFGLKKNHGSDFFSRFGFGFGTNFLSKLDVLKLHWEGGNRLLGTGVVLKLPRGPVSANPCRIPAPKLQLLSRLTRWISRWKLRKSIFFFQFEEIYGFSYYKWSFWGVLGIPPFKETPIYDDYISDITLVLYCKSFFSFC